MAYYLFRGRMSKQSIEAMVKNPQSRTEAAQAIIEAAGEWPSGQRGQSMT
jgi:aspartate/glutamate racemase